MKQFFLFALLAISAPAAAQTQAQMASQASKQLKAADATMNDEWKRAYAYMKRLDAADTSRGGGFGYAAAMLESQRAWLKFRDTQCVIESGEFAGGTMQPMARVQCLTRLTGERTRQLAALQWKRP